MAEVTPPAGTPSPFGPGYHLIPVAEFRAAWAASNPYHRFIHTESGRPILVTFLAHPDGGGIQGWLMPDGPVDDLS